MSLFVILLGGRLTATPRLMAQIAGARVIAADSGMAHAEALGVIPEVWVGDFDSASADLQARFAHVPRLAFPPEKDATDGEIAVVEALKRGAKRLVLVGAFGGQADHVMGIATLAIALKQAGIDVMLTSGDEEGWPLLPGALALDVTAGARVSLIPIADFGALTISGVKWPLENRDVPAGSSLTLSNEATGPVSISVQSGKGIVVAYP
jgi:thiamine pyrophosphokinase